jgi:hypothetical protein
MVNFIEDVPVYDGEAYLEQWLKVQGYSQKDQFICDHVADGKTEDEIDSLWEEVTNEFYDWCEKKAVEANDC